MTRLVALIVAVAALSAGLGYWLSPKPQAQNPASEKSAGMVGQILPEFQFADLDGNLVSHRDFTGAPLIINLWATWCAPCLEEMPLLNDMAQELRPQGLRLLGLALDEPAKVAAFLDRLPVSYPVAITDTLAGMRYARALGNDRGLLPYTVFVDRQGRIARIKVGQLKPDEAASFVREIL